MSVILAITKPTFDVLTETNPKNFIFHSELNHLKTAVYGTFTVSGNGVVTVAHGLGYRPMALAYYCDTSNNTDWYITMGTYPSGDPFRVSAPANVAVLADTTNVYFDVSGNTGDELLVHYEIFFEGD